MQTLSLFRMASPLLGDESTGNNRGRGSDAGAEVVGQVSWDRTREWMGKRGLARGLAGRGAILAFLSGGPLIPSGLPFSV